MVLVKIYTDGLTGTPLVYNTEGQTLLSPFAECYRLDEALDSASVTLAYIDRIEPFAPFTFISIEDTNVNGDEEFWCVQNDEVTEYVAIGKYTHKILLIETTKYLERFIVGTKTVTQPISVIIDTSKQLPADIYGFGGNILSFNRREHYSIPYVTPIANNRMLTLCSLKSTFSEQYGLGDVGELQYMKKIKISVSASGYGIIAEFDIPDDLYYPLKAPNETREIDLSLLSGNSALSIEYSFEYQGTGGLGMRQHISYSMFVYDPDPEHAKQSEYYISEVCEILCKVADPHMEKGTSRFIFYDENGTLSNIVSPEFTFSEATLYEALSTVGGYIHGIPRLKIFFKDGDPVFQVKFDYLGVSEYAKLTDYRTANGRTYTQNTEEFCTALDTVAENLVITEKKVGGDTVNAVGAPALWIGKTLRAENGQYRITEGTAIIATDYPIERIQGVYISYNGGSEYDITPYIYEQAEYAALSSFTKAYPHSKQYALYYTHGEKNIKGLTFEKENILSQVFEDPAIVAIYERASNSSISSLFTAANQMLFNVRVVYTPIVSVKVRQRKGRVEDNRKNVLISYNQSANKIDSSAYGKNLAGTVSRLGTLQSKGLYITDRATARKTASGLVGKMLSDGSVIAAVTVEYFTEYAKVQLESTEKFNRINQYVGIKSNIRQYEVSEKLAQDRHVIYEDFLVVSEHAPSTSAENTFMTKKFFTGLSGVFCGVSGSPKHLLDTVLVQGYNEERRLVPLFLPVTAFGVGRSMAFSFSYLDNYGAGYGTTHAFLGGNYVDGNATAFDTYRLQENVSYTDGLGGLESFLVRFHSSRTLKENSCINKSANNFPALSLEDMTNFVYDSTAAEESVLRTPDDNRLVVYKDNRERICMTYQMHIVSEGEITISPSAGEHLGFVSDENTQLYIYKLRYPLGIFDSKIPAGTIVERFSFMSCYSTEPHNSYLKATPRANFGDQKGVTGEAWAVADINGNIVFFKNIHIEPYQAMPTLYLSGVHSLEKI